MVRITVLGALTATFPDIADRLSARLWLVVLLGRHNWWLPRWLDRLLPQLRIEHGEGPPAPAKQPQPAAV
ncbi:hypothetical protein [Kitasatospora sp. NPDC059673]|uniref:hypothetical protein n=1 Tax=Kitasatospora sp. NPDC059673 TaxID=3346901 RepID=UPI0036C7F360